MRGVQVYEGNGIPYSQPIPISAHRFCVAVPIRAVLGWCALSGKDDWVALGHPHRMTKENASLLQIIILRISCWGSICYELTPNGEWKGRTENPTKIAWGEPDMGNSHDWY